MSTTPSSVEHFSKLLSALNPEMLLLSVLLLSSLIVLQRIISSLQTKRGESGLERKASTVSVDGSNTLPVRDYVSEIQGIAGRPDAVISENGYLIPVERKPLARKLRDRYVAQLLVYMRLIEEFEGKRPPYGYLILGGNCRKIKIENTQERQEWLQGILTEMRAILETGAPANATPHQKKCKKCDVREHCSYRSDVREPANTEDVDSRLVQFPKRSTPIQ